MQLGSHHSSAYSHSPHAPSPSPISPSASFSKLPHVPSIPSLSTIQSVKKCIARSGNKSGVLQQKHLVQLDWAPTEDGSHILTVAVGSRVLFLAPVSKDIVKSDLKLSEGKRLERVLHLLVPPDHHIYVYVHVVVLHYFLFKIF